MAASGRGESPVGAVVSFGAGWGLGPGAWHGVRGARECALVPGRETRLGSGTEVGRAASGRVIHRQLSTGVVGQDGRWHSGGHAGVVAGLDRPGVAGRVRRLRKASHGALPGVPCRPERGRTEPGATGAGAARAAGRARGGPVRGRGAGGAARPQGTRRAGAHGTARGGAGGCCAGWASGGLCVSGQRGVGAGCAGAGLAGAGRRGAAVGGRRGACAARPSSVRSWVGAGART